MARRNSVSGKLIFSYVLIVILTVILAGGSIHSIFNNKQVAGFAQVTLEERYGRMRRTLDNLYALHSQIQALALGTKEVSDDELNSVASKLAEFEDAAAKMRMTRYPKVIGPIKEAALKYQDVYNSKVEPSLKAGKIDEARKFFNDELSPLYLVSNYNICVINGFQISVVDNAVKTIASNTPLIIVSVITAIVLIICISIGYAMPHSIRLAVKHVNDNLKRMEQGDISKPILTRRTDEFGEILRGLELMRSQWQEIVNRIRSTSADVTDNMQKIHESSERTSEDAQRSQATSLTVAAASDEMVSTTADIARNCENAAKAADESSNTTNAGVKEVTATIEEIKSQVEKTKADSANIQALVDQTEKIGVIVQTIEDIASQTNLLALNAAIEAARAGEAGKGFAVVADEVRALASRTGASTQQITKMVGEIQQDARSANDSMGQSLENMNGLAKRADSLNKLLNEIIDGVEKVHGQITQIATAAEEQTTATSEISTNMQNITTSCKNFADEAQQTESQISQCAGKMTELNDMVDRLKV